MTTDPDETAARMKRIEDLKVRLKPLRNERDDLIQEINEIEDEIYEAEHPEYYPDYEPPAEDT